MGADHENLFHSFQNEDDDDDDVVISSLLTTSHNRLFLKFGFLLVFLLATIKTDFDTILKC